MVLDPWRAQPSRHGNATHDDPGKHGGGHSISDGTPVDVPAHGDMAGQKGFHPTPDRRVSQGCHACHVRDSSGSEGEVDLPGEGDLESETREDFRLCDDGSRRLQEASVPDALGHDRNTQE